MSWGKAAGLLALLALTLVLAAPGCGKYGKPVRSERYRNPPAEAGTDAGAAGAGAQSAAIEASDDEDAEKAAK